MNLTKAKETKTRVCCLYRVSTKGQVDKAENENMVCAPVAGFAKLETAGVVRLHLGGFSPRLFNVDELPKRTAVCCIT